MLKNCAKRLFSLALVVIMVLTMLPTDVLAAELHEYLESGSSAGTSGSSTGESNSSGTNNEYTKGTAAQVMNDMGDVLDLLGIESGMTDEEMTAAMSRAGDEDFLAAMEKVQNVDDLLPKLSTTEAALLKTFETYTTYMAFRAVLEEQYGAETIAKSTNSFCNGKLSIEVNTGTVSVSSDTMTVDYTNSFKGYSSYTFKITNTMGKPIKLKFDYSFKTFDKIKINGTEYSNGATGTYPETQLNSNEFITITGYSATMSSQTDTFKLSNFVITEQQDTSNVTVNFSAGRGSVTADGTAVTAGTAFSIVSANGVTLAATSGSGTFLGWVNEDGQLLSTETSYLYKPVGDGTITAAFAHKDDAAWFKSKDGTYLSNDLNAIATKASTVVLAADGTLPKGNYTIPSGVTLLIPFDDANTLYTTKPEYVQDSWTKPTAYRTLTMAEGANIQVNGAISLSAKFFAAHSPALGAGSPTGPVSFINMASGSKIEVNGGGKLYAWGYITGSGEVIAHDNADIYEFFQIMDFRGGRQSRSMQNKVFPISQYYIQNIEVALTLEYGSRESAYTGFHLSVTGVAAHDVTFISKDSGSMFTMGAGSKIIKRYDGTKDRLIVDSYGDVSISGITMMIGGVHGGIDSSNYDLPITNNISITIHSGTITINQNIALLPGASITVEKGATCKLGQGKNVYIYDADQWGGYCGSNNKKLIPVLYAPSRTHDRTEKDLIDAEIFVNGGTLDASAGYVYTTAGGANVHGADGAIVKINAGTQTTTHQLVYGAEKPYPEIAITPAKLKHGDGTYTAATTTNTYVYTNGKWHCGAADDKHNDHKHSWNEGKDGKEGDVTTPATCTKEGVRTYTCTVCKFTNTKSIPKKAHNYIEKDDPKAENEKDKATCTAQAVYYKVCSECGASAKNDENAGQYTYSHGKPLGHDFSKKNPTREYLHADPTCETPAKYYYCCSRCDESAKGNDDTRVYEHGTALGHDWEEKKEDAHIATAGTCMTPATYYKVCKACHVNSKDTFQGEIDSGKHDERCQLEWRASDAANHGQYHSGCDQPTGTTQEHDWSNNDGTCKVCGYGCKHSGGQATCTEPKICETCHKPYSPATGHNFTGESDEDKYLKEAATCTKNAVYYKSCIVCGESSEGTAQAATFAKPETALGHKWNGVTVQYRWTGYTKCVATRICGREDCNHTETATAEGEAITSNITTQPGCESAGERTYTANFTETWAQAQHKPEPISAEGHKYGDPSYDWKQEDGKWTCTATRKCQSPNCGHPESATASVASKETTPPTCTVMGETTYTATFDPEYDWAKQQTKVKQDISTKEHKTVKTEAKPATCISGGHNAYYTCSDCKKVFKDQQGKQETTITEEETPANGHSMTVNMPGKPASCTEDGYTGYKKCANCDHIEGKLTLSKLGHSTKKTEAKPANCTEDGTNAYYTCSTCNKVFKDQAGAAETTVEAEKLNKLGHNTTHHEKVDATCLKTGTIEYWSCDRCKKNFSDEACSTVVKDLTIAKKAHQMAHTDAKDATCTEAGNNEYWFCSGCGKYYLNETGGMEYAQDGYILPATGHSMTETKAKAATCTQDGTQGYHYCSNCKRYFEDAEGSTPTTVEDRKLSAKGHSYGKTEIRWADNNLSCTATRSCSVCSDEVNRIQTQTVTAKPSVSKPATCLTKGDTTYTATFTDAWVPEKVQTKLVKGNVEKNPNNHEKPNDFLYDSESITADTHTKLYACCKKEAQVEKHQYINGVCVCSQKQVITITWIYGDITKEEKFEYNAVPVFGFDDPVKASDKTYHYDFAGWSTTQNSTTAETLGAATENTTYYVVFKANPHIVPAKSHDCSVCGFEGATPHDYNNATCVTAATCRICGGTTGDPMGHNFGAMTNTEWTQDENGDWWVTLTSTCDREGDCLGPGKDDRQKVTMKIKAVKGTVTKDATCTTAGAAQFAADFGKPWQFVSAYSTTEIQSIPALGHDLEHRAAVDPTCKTNGNKEYWLCKRCGNLYTDSKGEHITSMEAVTLVASTQVDSYHSWGNPTVTDSTCTADGKEVYTCTRCGGTKEKKIDAKGHSFTVNVDEVPATCYSTGVSAHKKCIRCDETSGKTTLNKKNHTYGEVSIRWSTTTPYALGSAGSTVICTATRSCTVQGCTDSADGHTQTAQATVQSERTQEPSCTQVGTMTYTAAFNDDWIKSILDEMPEEDKQAKLTTTEEIQVKEHSYSITYAWTVSEESASCKATRHCSECGSYEYSTATVKAARTEPTCTEKGKIVYTAESFNENWAKAEDANKVEAENRTVTLNALGHTWVEKGRLPATCTEAGWVYSECSVEGCDGKNTETLTAPGHDLQQVIAQAPTCTEKGVAEHQECKREYCNYKETGAEIPALGHDWKFEPQWSVDKSTCTLNASCQRPGCGETEGEMVSANAEVTTPATCTKKGEMTYTATFTAEWAKDHKPEVTTAPIEMVPHTYEQKRQGSLESAATCTSPAIYWIKCDNCEHQSGSTMEVGGKRPHDWNDTVYTWTATYDGCTAERTCKYADCKLKETASAKKITVDEKTYQPTCTEDGKKVYTATFAEESWAAGTAKQEVTWNKLGHDYENQPIKYIWADNGSTCTAEQSCGNTGCTEKRSAVATKISSRKSQEPTCTQLGKTTYTATFPLEHSWAMSSEKEISDISKLEHQYGTVRYDWVKDSETNAWTCTAIRQCILQCCSNYIESAPAVKITETMKQASTCTVMGWTTYTPTFSQEHSWAAPTTKDEQDRALAPHTENAGIITKSPFFKTEGTRSYYCADCAAFIRDEVIPATGKLNISVISDSITAFTDYSNGKAAENANTTLAGGLVWFPMTGKDSEWNTITYQGEIQTAEQIWIYRAAQEIGANILVNNSWSGSAVHFYQYGAPGMWQDRCVQLHDNTGENAGQEPDIIVVYMGTNDFKHVEGVYGEPAKDENGNLITPNLGSFEDTIAKVKAGTLTKDSIPETTMDAYYISFAKMQERYKNSEIYVMTLLPFKVNKQQPTVFNEEIRQMAAYFNATLVDLEKVGIESDIKSFEYLMEDWLHPNNKGMQVLANAFVSALRKNSKLLSETEKQNVVDVCYDLSGSGSAEGTYIANGVTALEGIDRTALVGKRFEASLKLKDDNNKLFVTVKMGGKDITKSCYSVVENDKRYGAIGKIVIENVTGEIEIIAVAHTHKYGSVVTNSTCIAEGYTTYTCVDARCGHQYTANKTSALGHSFTTKPGSMISGATCTEAAVYKVKCDRCSVISKDDTVAVGVPNGHHYTKKLYGTQASKATCTAPAKHYRKCDDCGEDDVTTLVEVGEPIDHSFNTRPSENVAKPATCTEAEFRYVQCDNCSAISGTDMIPYGEPLNHSYLNNRVSEEKASNATCTEAEKYYVKCDRCDEVNYKKTVFVGEPNGHSFNQKASTELETAATCTTAAIYYVQCDNCTQVDRSKRVPVGQANGHSFTAEEATDDYLKSVANCENAAVYYKSCTVCGENSKGHAGEVTFKYGKANGHSFTNRKSDVLVSPADCNNAAVYKVQCDNCSSISDEDTVKSGSPLGHAYGKTTYEWTKDKDGWSCTAKHVCGNDSSHVETVEATITDVIALAATCESKGKTKYTAKFEVLWAIEQSQTVTDISEIGHAYSQPTYEWKLVNKKWTCVAERVCSNDNSHVDTTTATVTSVEKTAATCTVKGWTTYTAAFAEKWAEQKTRDEQDISAKGHSYGVTTYVWSLDGKTCTAERVCSVASCKNKDTVRATVTSTVSQDATCTEMGETKYTAAFSVDWAETQTTTRTDIPALNHSYGTTTYDWKQVNGKWTCTAKRVCSHNEEHVQTAEAIISSTVVKDATCTQMGKTRYTATFTVTWATTRTRTETDIAATEHSYGATTYEWSADGKTCTAKRVCANNAAHVETASATVQGAQTKAPTCTGKGETTYTATFAVSWAVQKTKTVADIDAVGHAYGKTTYEWSENGKSCTAKHICANDASHVETAKATITSTVSKNATCTEMGDTTYTATFNVDWAVQNTKTVTDINAKGHVEVIDKAVAATCTVDGKTEGKHCSVCKEVLVAQQTVKANGHKEVVDKAVEATCEKDGKTEGKHCSVCNEILVAQTTITKLGHDEIEIEEVPATCTQDGHGEGKQCIRCKKYTVIPSVKEALGHNIVSYEAKIPTLGSVGWNAYEKCLRCSYSTYVELPALEVPVIDSYEAFVNSLKYLELVAEQYARANPGKDPLALVIKYIRTGVDRYNSGSWGIMAGYEDTDFADYVKKVQDEANVEIGAESEMLNITGLKDIEEFYLPNGDWTDFGHMFGMMDISYHNNFSQNHIDVSGWGGDLVDLVSAADRHHVTGTLNEMIKEVRNNILLKTFEGESDVFSQTDMYGDMDGLYLIAQLKEVEYEADTLCAIMKAYFTTELNDETRADYYLKNRLDGVSTRNAVREAVYKAYIGNKVVTTLENTRDFETKNLDDLRKACCYAFADYMCELAGDYVDASNNIYYTDFSAETSTLAPGITQEIHHAISADGKQMVYYLATADITRDDVHVYANYNENDPSLGWKMSRVEDQMMAAQNKYGDPNSASYIPNYNVIAGINADGFNMNTGEPMGLLIMNGVKYHGVSGSGFFAITKEGKAILGTTAEWNALDESTIGEAVGGFGTVLVKDGKVCITRTDSYYSDRNPRTAVGITRTGKVVFMVLDGRQEPTSCGGSMIEIAQIMLEAGCVDAINLDGGGSTTYVAKQEGTDTLSVVSKPSDGFARSVSSTLMMVSTAPSSTAFDYALLESKYNYMTVGSTMQITAKGVSATGNTADIPENAYWAVEDEAYGSITADGVLTAKRLGKLTVNLISDGKVIGTKTVAVQEPTNLYFTKTNMNAVYGQTVELPVKVLYEGKEMAVNANDIIFTLSNDKAGTIQNFAFTAVESELKNVTVTAALASAPSTSASITVNLFKQGETSFDFDQATDGDRQFAWVRDVLNAKTDDNSFYEIIDADKSMTTSYTFAIDMTQIPLPKQLEELTYMLPGSDIEGASAWTFLLQLAERVSVLTEVTPTFTVDERFDIDISEVKVVNDYFYLTEKKVEGNEIKLTLKWKDQTKAIDPETANPMCILSGLKLTPKADADWGNKGQLQIVNQGKISYKIYLRANALYSFACKEENQKVYGLHPFENPDPNVAGGIERGAWFGDTYKEFEDGYTLSKSVREGWFTEEDGYAYYVNGQKVTGIQNIDGLYYSFNEAGINVGKTPYTGIVEVDNKLCYSRLGVLTSGWVAVNESYYYFDKVTFQAHSGTSVIDGLEYVFNDKCELIFGAKQETAGGIRYYWAGRNLARIWAELEDGMHYVDPDGYLAFGNCAVYEDATLDPLWYHFDEETGVLIGLCDGFIEFEGQMYYCENGVWYYGAVAVEGGIIYCGGNGRVYVNTYCYLESASAGLGKGHYWCDENGRVQADGFVTILGYTYYFTNYQRALGFTKINGDYYFFNTANGKMYKNIRLWVDGENAYGVAGGYYNFLEDGKMNIVVDSKPDQNPQPDQTNRPNMRPAGAKIEEEDDRLYFIIDGVKQKQGLYKFNGEFYYAKSNRSLARSEVVWIESPENLTGETQGYFAFDENGKMIRTGFVEDSHDGVYYYDNIVRARGFTKIGQDYYYFNEATGAMYRNKQLWIDENSYGIEKGYFVFGADGKLVQTGFVEGSDGSVYYHENMVGATGFTKVGEDYYYFDEDSGAMYKDIKIWIEENSYDVESGYFIFGADGKLIKTGFVEGSDGNTYYYENVVKARGLMKVGEEFYFFNQSSGVMYRSVTQWIGANAYGIESDYFEIGEDGKIVKTGFRTNDDGSVSYYEDMVKAKGLTKIGEAYYFFNETSGKMITGKTVRVGDNAYGIESGFFAFDEEGKAIVSGFVEGGDSYTYYYEDMVKAKGLTKIGEDYYFFDETDGKMFKNKKMWVQSNIYAVENSFVAFDGDGKLVKTGFVEDGDGNTYYYLDMVKAEGLTKIGEDYYFFDETSGIMYKNTKQYIGGDNVYGIEAGQYKFLRDGTMTTATNDYVWVVLLSGTLATAAAAVVVFLHIRKRRR